jgi:hypothetical protein
MSGVFESVYPDFLRTGLVKLHSLGVGHDLLALFSGLEHYRRDLHEHEDVPGILKVMQQYVGGLGLCHTQAFYLVDAVTHGFELAQCEPSSESAMFGGVVKSQIKAGRFAWALRHQAPVFFDTAGPSPVRGVFHPLAVASQTVGMFCGLLRTQPAPVQDITFNLLSMLLGSGADALAAARKTEALASQIVTLHGLLPICAWCKKVRDDRGYWNQIERYVESRSEATFSHGMCPDCAKKMVQTLSPPPGPGSA